MTTLADFYRLFPSRPLLAVPAAALGPADAPRPVPTSTSRRPAPRYRERSVGSGYGRSSGYAKLGTYAPELGAGLVRVC